MQVLTAGEMADMDRLATEQYGVPSLTLMENAGCCAAELAAEITGGVRGRRIAIFCGRGNNGGDGLVAGRQLHCMGAIPKVFVLGSLQDLKADPRANYEMASNAGVSIRAIADAASLEALREEVEESSLIIDAILGTGFEPPVRGLAGDAIALINDLKMPVLALDLPSGLSADGGHVTGEAVRASHTVTFGLPKVGQFLFPAAAQYGSLFLADIGFPAPLAKEVPASHHLITEDDLVPLLPQRSPESHKGTYGHVLLLAGSRGLAGASILCARGALRAGAGLVTVALPESQAFATLASLPEAMVLPLPETSQGTAGERALEVLLENLSGKKVLAVGPGLSGHPETARLLHSLIPRIPIPMVIDADGLNALASSTAVLLESQAEIVLTPHPGELGRLLGQTTTEIQENRIMVARDFSKKYGVIVALKGANTIIGTPSGEVHINTSGNPGMATGGMGDVLTGMIAAFIAQGIGVLESTILGVHLHGRAGDLAGEDIGPWGYLAGEVADHVPEAVGDILSWTGNEKSSHGNLRLIVPR